MIKHANATSTIAPASYNKSLGSFPWRIINLARAVIAINNGKVTAHKSSEFWIDVGTQDRLKLANTLHNEEN